MLKKRNTIMNAFGEVLNVSKTLFWGNYFLTFLQGIFNAAPIWCLQLFLDNVLETSGSRDWDALWISLSLYVLSNVGYHIIKGVTDFNYEYYDLLVAQRMIHKTNQKVADLDPIMFEDTNALEMIEKAYKGTSSIRVVVDTIMMTLLYYLPELLLIMIYLYSSNPLLPLIVVLIICVVERVESDYFSEVEDQVAYFSRKIEKFTDYSCGLRYYRETKTLDLHKYFLSEVEKLITQKQDIEWKYFCKSIRTSLIEKGASTLGHICILALLFVCTVRGSISIGMFAALVTSLSGMFTMMEDLVGHISGGISEALGKVRNYFSLQNIRQEETHVCDKPEEIESITFQDVDFTYPNQNQEALKNVSLTIRKGEHIAIVGENGSGKSTLTKLIAGIYSPTKGEIYVNGKNIKLMSRQKLQGNVSAVFQNFARYKMTVRENTVIGDPNSTITPESILDEVGFCFNAESKLSMNTLLSREFGGTDISGGQWQRLAIARGFYRDKDIILMDEQTSSIAPVEEQKMLDLLQMISAQKMSVIVTHRLGSIRYADKILVMKKGSIVGFGTHTELLDCCTEYQKIWESQAQFYN